MQFFARNGKLVDNKGRKVVLARTFPDGVVVAFQSNDQFNSRGRVLAVQPTETGLSITFKKGPNPPEIVSHIGELVLDNGHILKIHSDIRIRGDKSTAMIILGHGNVAQYAIANKRRYDLLHNPNEPFYIPRIFGVQSDGQSTLETVTYNHPKIGNGSFRSLPVSHLQFNNGTTVEIANFPQTPQATNQLLVVEKSTVNLGRPSYRLKDLSATSAPA